MGNLKEEYGDFNLDEYGIESQSDGTHKGFKGGGSGRVKTQK